MSTPYIVFTKGLLGFFRAFEAHVEANSYKFVVVTKKNANQIKMRNSLHLILNRILHLGIPTPVVRMCSSLGPSQVYGKWLVTTSEGSYWPRGPTNKLLRIPKTQSYLNRTELARVWIGQWVTRSVVTFNYT